MKEEFDSINELWKIERMRFQLICKITNYEPANAISGIVQINEEELNQLRGLIDNILSETTQQPPKEAESVSERINRVFKWDCELRLKRFLRLEKMINVVARPIENWKPAPELKKITTEAIRLVLRGRLEKSLKEHMDLEISKIYMQRIMREYEKLWEQVKDVSADEAVKLMEEAIERIGKQIRADCKKYELERTRIIERIIGDSINAANVYSRDVDKIRNNFVEILKQQNILCLGFVKQYNHYLESGKTLKYSQLIEH